MIQGKAVACMKLCLLEYGLGRATCWISGVGSYTRDRKPESRIQRRFYTSKAPGTQFKLCRKHQRNKMGPTLLSCDLSGKKEGAAQKLEEKPSHASGQQRSHTLNQLVCYGKASGGSWLTKA